MSIVLAVVRHTAPPRGLGGHGAASIGISAGGPVTLGSLRIKIQRVVASMYFTIANSMCRVGPGPLTVLTYAALKAAEAL
jgi:hypothetical protein